MKNTLTMGSLFDGSGGFPLSALIAGITPVWASEIDPFPIRVTTRRLPMMKHLGSITELDGGEIEPVDIITMGSPCFPAGTLILAEDGYKPIEKIRIGDKVLTHEGRWRSVTAIGSKMGTTIILKGNHYGLECTPNHPIYSAESRRSYPRLENGKRTSRVHAAEKREWIRAEDMIGRLWAVPNSFECLPLPREEEKSRATAHAMPIIDKDLMYLVGLWLGDGWVRDGQRSNRPEGQCWAQVIICASDKKLPDVERAFDSLGIRYKTSEGRTVYKVMASHKALCTFLTTHFGKHAEGKRIPSWALTLDRESRESLLKGVTDTDGYRIREDRVRINTVSKELAHGLRLLAESLGYSTTIYFNKQKPQQVIEGRMVSQRDTYTVELLKSRTKSRKDDGKHSWYNVRSKIETGCDKRVYNLTVDEDNSYVAEGIVVHNCQDLSIAGRREGLVEGKRSSLFFEALRIIREMREKTNGEKPRYIIWENVTGALNSSKGDDFRKVIEEITRLRYPEVSIPRSEKWTGSGLIMEDGFSLAWRVLNAQYWGVPQRRKRIYLVADLNAGSAGKILFESEGLPWNNPEGFRAWQAAPESIGVGAPETGTICLNDQGGERMDLTEDFTGTLRANGSSPPLVFQNHGQDSRFKGPLEIADTVNATYGTGGNNQPLVCGTPKLLKIRCGVTGQGGRGALIQDNRSATISCNGNEQTLFEPVAFSMLSKDSSAMRSTNPDSGIKESSISLCVDTAGVNPACNQGGMMIVDSAQAGQYSASKESFFTKANLELASTLAASDAKDPPIVNEEFYRVRRLMPVECARLQGFPDWWCKGLEEENPSEEEVSFWRKVFSTHALATGKKTARIKSDQAIRKWLKSPHSDAAEYKMWGNGIALPCAVYVMTGIAYWSKEYP